MAGRFEWVLLAYRMPREPSTPRIAVWRTVRRLGVAQLLDGLVALPADARTRERLEWVSAEVVEAGGEASVWLGRLASARQERELAAAMALAVAAEYRDVELAATQSRDAGVGSRRRTLARLRRELRRIGERDFFPPVERDHARSAVEALASTLVDA